MAMSSDDSDAEFYDAREEIPSPRPQDSQKISSSDSIVDKQVASSVVTDLAFSKTGDVPDSKLPDVGHVSAAENERNQDFNNMENTSQKIPSIETSGGQTPDLLACIQDRPTDLPGVIPVSMVPIQEQITPVQEASHDVEEPVPPLQQAQSKDEGPPPTAPVPDSTVKKKTPPARPAPPKRPPPPKKSYLTSRPYLSESDDGLLTPNTTVDNLTKEFTEALKHDQVLQNKENPSISRHTGGTKSVTTNSEDSASKQKESASNHNGSVSPASASKKDEEILSSVIVKNLDTGESMPLSTAAEHVSQCLNPIALQIMSRTREFSYTSSSASVNSHELQVNPASALENTDLADSDSIASDDIDIGKDAAESKSRKGKKLKDKRKKFKKIVGKGVSKVKVVAGAQVEKAVHRVKHGKEEEQLNVSSDEDSAGDLGSSSSIKIKASSSNKGPHHFSHPKQVQDIAVHVGAVWCMKFSHCGRLLATSGQDNVIWVWVLKDFYNYFNDMRIKYDSKDEMFGPQDTSSPHIPTPGFSSDDEVFSSPELAESRIGDEEEDTAPFRQVPFSSYVGHSADVLDLAWSKNFFILSSSMDKTVRLWHISRKECLCCFQHIDFVTAIAFHPRDDRYFLSGSLDSKLRLWNIPDKKVALWNEVSPEGSSSSNANGGGGALITTVNFCENGKFAVCGTYDGRCIFFDTEHLKYHTQIHVRSSRGRNTKGHKITGIEALPGEHKILVTSNDSRVRLYDLRDLSLVCKYRGHTNMSSQIKASFSPDSKYIICGSEDKCVYIWKTSLPQDIKLSSLRRDRNDSWESMKAHDAVVTCAVFAPQPQLLYKSGVVEALDTKRKTKPPSILSHFKKQEPEEVNVIISADFNGCIKVTVCAQ